MTKEKALEKVEAIYTINGDFSHAMIYVTDLYGLTPEFWKENFSFVADKMLAKYPSLYFGGVI